jgi:glycerol uptake facilitator-like aquaporin
MMHYVVEFLGTALLIGAGAWGGGLMAVAALAIAIYFGTRISGAHFNPAVSMFKYLRGDIGPNKLLLYLAAQTAAAVSIFFMYNL